MTDAHREQETPATPCPGIQEGHYYVHCRDCGHSPVATPCPLRKAIEDEIKVCRNHQRQAQGLSRTGVANRWATIAERMENLLREHGDCGRAPATLTPFERESLDIAIAKWEALIWQSAVTKAYMEMQEEWVRERNALRTLVEKQREALRNVLNRAEQLFSSDRPPPKSCGRCGTPNASCDGDCVDAAYIADDLWKVHAVLAAEVPRE